jgi:hypothetical protein
MKTGFWISFIGSLPMGYLNLIALRVFMAQSWGGLSGYVLGVILIEAVVIYVTFWGAERLLKNARLLLWIDIFAVIFLFGLSVSCLPQTNNALPPVLPALDTHASPIVLGLWFNTLNVLQISFRAGWNVFLLEKKKISPQNLYVYIIGALLGTCVGMVGFVYLAHYYLFVPNDYIFFVLFLILAVLALGNLFWKRKHWLFWR